MQWTMPRLDRTGQIPVGCPSRDIKAQGSLMNLSHGILGSDAFLYKHVFGATDDFQNKLLCLLNGESVRYAIRSHIHPM